MDDEDEEAEEGEPDVSVDVCIKVVSLADDCDVEGDSCDIEADNEDGDCKDTDVDGSEDVIVTEMLDSLEVVVASTLLVL